MRAGLLRHAIVIQSPTETRDSIGGVVKSWATFASMRASVEPYQAREIARGEQVRADVSHKIVMRYVSGLSPKFRIAWTVGATTRYFHIVQILNIGERDKTINVLAMEEV